MRHARAGTVPSPAAVTLAGTIALAVVVVLGPSVPTTRDGIDSTNFALAVDQYAPALHQPHPPGYPIHVALARLVAAVYRPLAAGGVGAEVSTAVAALRLWSLFCGVLAVIGVRHLARALGAAPVQAWLSAAVVVTCPLFLITSVRPLSDAPGLLFSLAAQIMLLEAASGAPSTLPGARRTWSARLLVGATLAGLALGVRVQTAWLTLPLLTVTLVGWTRSGRLPAALTAFVGLAVGAAAWALPLLNVLGPDEYWRLVSATAADDVAGVEMLATRPTAHMLKMAVINTFIAPWGGPIVGGLAVIASAAGAVGLLRHARWRFLQLSAMTVPYLAFHLLFQETASVRYALPVIAMQAVLMGMTGGRTWVSRLAVAAIAAMGALTSARAIEAYWGAPSPVAQAMRDLEATASGMPNTPSLGFHHAVVRAARGSAWEGAQLQAPVRYEWLSLVDHFTRGARGPVWFLANERRTDLALIDPRSRRVVRAYAWPAAAAPLLGGIQPGRVAWHEIWDPGWMLLRGWSLTPETHGVSRRDGHAPGGLDTEGRIKRRPDAAVMMIGGRNLGGPCDTGATVEAFIDGESVARWTAGPHTAFLQVVPLPAGALDGPGRYASLRVTARDAEGTARLVDVALESFDVQSRGTAMAQLGAGWHVPELDAATGHQWRWMEEAGAVHVDGFGDDVELTLRGAGPAAPAGATPQVEVRAGEVALGVFPLDASFSWRLRVPASTLAAAGGRLTLQSDQWHIPDEVTGNGDRRRLSLQLFAVDAKIAE